jgi:serine-type D-Ala-D-Ala carboxypeptidase
MNSVYDAMTQTESISIDPTRLQRAVAVAEDAVHKGPYPSAVLAVANANTTILTHTVAHPERAPVREDGIFLLASITKPIIATAIMRLVEQGRLLLSDPIVEYIPEFAPFGKQAVTAWHILTHTSGLEEAHWWPELYQQRAPAEAFLRAVCQSPLHFDGRRGCGAERQALSRPLYQHRRAGWRPVEQCRRSGCVRPGVLAQWCSR